MKRIAPALIALGLLAGVTSCSDANSGFITQGVVEPTPDPTNPNICVFSSGDTKGLLGAEYIQVNALKANTGGLLTRLMGLQLSNALVATTVANPTGAATQGNETDILVDSVDVDIDDLGGSKLASETLIASGYVPQGGQAVTSFDVIAKPFADLLNSKSDAFDVQLSFVVHGHTTGNSNVSTSPFRYLIHVRYDDPTALFASVGDGGAAPLGVTPCL